MNKKLYRFIILLISLLLLIFSLYSIRNTLNVKKFLTNIFNLSKYEEEINEYQYNIENISINTDIYIELKDSSVYTFLYEEKNNEVAMIIDVYEKTGSLESFYSSFYDEYKNTIDIYEETLCNGFLTAKYIYNGYFYYDIIFETDKDQWRLTFACLENLVSEYENKFRNWGQNIKINDNSKF